MRLRSFCVLTLLLACPASTQISISLEEIGRVSGSPVAIAHAGDQRLFIVEQAGRIRIHDAFQVLPTPFLDISPLVLSGGEQGLLGLAFHPNYRQNGFFYVNYTSQAGGGDTVIARYTVSASNPNVANPGSALTLLTIDQPYANHNGGQIQFGPDSYLYIGMGDGGAGGDPKNHAQRLNSLLGKMLRIDVDHGSPYAIPADNPFFGALSIENEIWALGLRNPWRFTFDRSTGDIFIGDVGQNTWEEINFQPASSRGRENYGWRVIEGRHCYNPPVSCDMTGLVLPILEYRNTGGNGDCSVTGGYRYRGLQFPSLRGIYFYGDYCSGKIWGATQQSNGSWSSQLLLDTNFFISTFGEDYLGELYVASHGDGVIYRLKDPTARPRRRAVRR